MAELSREWLMSLNNYVQDFEEEAYLGAEIAAETLLESVRAEARQRSEWASLADSIEVWSQDGILIVGVQDQALVSQAFALEYGDETTPPSPLFRTSSAANQANDAYMDHLANQGMADR